MTTTEFDVRRGHATVLGDDGTPKAYLIDMQGCCVIDLVTPDLTVDEARYLGHALISWSAWRRRVIPQIDHYETTKQVPPSKEQA